MGTKSANNVIGAVRGAVGDHDDFKLVAGVVLVQLVLDGRGDVLRLVVGRDQHCY